MAEQLASLQHAMESRAAAHEQATVAIQERMDATDTKTAKDQEIMKKVHKEQSDIIKELREGLRKAEAYSKVLEEKIGATGVPQGFEDSTPDWKKRFDKDTRPRELKDGGQGFGEWRDKMERHIGTGDKRLRDALKMSEQLKQQVNEEDLRKISATIGMEIEELEKWDEKIQTSIISQVSGENHIRVKNSSGGLDAWRSLTTKWEPRNVTRGYEMRKKCMTIDKAKGYGDLSTKIETLKTYIREFEECTGLKYSDMDRKIAMLHICPENVQEDMRLKGYEEPEKTYEQVLHRLEELNNMHGGSGKS